MALADNYDQIDEFRGFNISLASTLLPCYAAASAELDGDMESFYAIYWNHLATKEADSLICVIITALIRGINILLYTPHDEEISFNYTNALVRYIYNTYGIAIGNNVTQFAYNPAFNAVICTRLYMHDLIKSEEFFVLYPAEVDIDIMIIPKLAFEYRSVIQHLNTQEEQFVFFNRYKNNIKRANNTFLRIPIRRGVGASASVWNRDPNKK